MKATRVRAKWWLIIYTYLASQSIYASHPRPRYSYLPQALFSSNNSALLHCPRLPFVIIDGLLYNIRANGIYALYVPYGEVLKYILATTYNEKYYFGEECILYNLRGLSISNKTYVVKSYVKHCPVC